MMANPNLSQTLVERSRSFKEPYEFLFKINDNIIVQRFFTVSDYNPLVAYSLELKECVGDCVEVIKGEMKNRTLDFMDEFKYYFADDPNFDRNESQDKYFFQVRVNGKLIIEEGWDATMYPAKIRYDVNIKKYIARIINTIQSAFAVPGRFLNTDYLHYDLIPQIDATTTEKTK